MILNILTLVLIVSMLVVLLLQLNRREFEKYRWIEFIISILLLTILIIRMII
ncbi:hypothetical protein oki184_33100 [Helicobacter pylori]